MVAEIEHMELRALRVERLIFSRDEDIAGSLVFACSGALLELYAPALEQFVRAFPAVELTVRDDRATLDVLRREADVVLRLSNDPPPSLIGCRLGAMAWGAFVARDAAPRAPEAFAWALGGEEHAQVEEVWLGALSAPARLLRVESFETKRQLIERGIAAGLLPRALGESWGLKRLEWEVDAPTTDVWLLTHEDLRHAPKVRALLDVIRRGHEHARELAQRYSAEGTGAEFRPGMRVDMRISSGTA